MWKTVLRSEGSALGDPTSKETELGRELERERLACPSPWPPWAGVRVCAVKWRRNQVGNSKRWLSVHSSSKRGGDG